MSLPCSPSCGDRRDPVLGIRGIHKGAAALLWGEPAASLRASAFCWHAACFRRGGHPPAPAFPLGKRERGSNSLLPQAISAPSGPTRWLGIRSSLHIAVTSVLAVQGALDPLAPQHLEVVQRLLPVLNGIPLGDDIPQRQVQ
jgi:hypothetical protein